MGYTTAGIAAATVRVAYYLTDDLGRPALTLTCDGTEQHIVVEGTDAEVLAMLDAARALVVARMVAAHPVEDPDDVPAAHPAVKGAYARMAAVDGSVYPERAAALSAFNAAQESVAAAWWAASATHTAAASASEGDEHAALPDDRPEPGDYCRTCGQRITWTGPSHLDWQHV